MFRHSILSINKHLKRTKSFRTVSISKSILEALPQAINTESAWSEIRNQLKYDFSRLVVLDDDPTGCQTVYDVNVLLDYSVRSLRRQLERDDKLFYILTNTRSLPEKEAISITRTVLDNLKLAALQLNYLHRMQIISRSDSTLRGHYPAEIDTIKQVELDAHATILCPAFFEGGRITLNDTHYVMEEDRLTPAGETPFAKDAHFGFKNSNLKDWVEEKTKGDVKRDDVVSITLEELRREDQNYIANKLESVVGYDSTIIVNAVNQHDLNAFILGLLASERNGFHYLYRTAASFVTSRAGLEPKRLLTFTNNTSSEGNRTGGLIVVGSYVPKSSAQLEELLRSTEIYPVELDVSSILSKSANAGDSLSPELKALVTATAKDINYQLYCGRDVVLYTSRSFAVGAELVDTATVSKVVCAIVKQMAIPLPFLVAKGGITSHDVAQHGLGMTSAVVLGQVEPGVPVWRAGAESKFPGMNYVVFPGNVGDNSALTRVAMKLGVRSKSTENLTVPSAISAMLTSLRDAKQHSTAIAAFNIYNLEGAKAVISAAETLRQAVILQVHPTSLEFGGRPLLDMLKSFKRHASVPVFVSLDHSERDEDVALALECGVDAVMVDGSALSLEENIRWTAKMVSWIHDTGAIAEAELGRLAGNEDGLSVNLRDARMTDPAKVGLFVRETKVDMLAVTIGNVHGAYSRPPQLDFARLEAIRTAAPPDMPLVLHGASGLDEKWIKGAMQRGVCKFNVNTDMREAAVRYLKQSLQTNQTDADYLPLMRGSSKAMEVVATEKMHLFMFGAK